MLAKVINDNIQLALEKGDDARKTIQRENYDDGIAKLEYQLSRLGETKEKAKGMIAEAKKWEKTVTENQKAIERLHSQVYDMNNKIEELKKDNDYLKCEVNELMTMKSNLETWQSASDFEYDLATHIYPPGTKVTFGPIFPNLMLWLFENQNTPEGEKATKRWNELQKKAKVQWTDKHENVLYNMLKGKMAITHQKVDFDANWRNDYIKYRGEILQIKKFINSD